MKAQDTFLLKEKKEKMIISDCVIEKAKNLGIISEEELINMIEMSAPTTHHLGTRRYNDFIFLIQDGSVKDINKDKVQKKNNICPDCNDDGDYCLTCGA